MKSWLPALGTVAFALSGCGHGGGGGGGQGIAVPFQLPNTVVAYAAPAGGPSSASASFVAATGITTSGIAAADTGVNTVTLTTTSAGNLSTITISIATPPGPAVAQTFAAVAQGTTTLTAGQFAALLSAIAVAPAGTANAVYQGVVAGLNFSAYGAWMQSVGAGSYNVGTYAFGAETAVMPVVGNAIYNGTTLGFGANGAVAFAFTGTVQATANFATNQIPTFQISNILTSNVSGGAPIPAIANFNAAAPGAITGSTYAVAIGNGTLTGTANGAFYGAGAAETAGTWNAANAGKTFTMIGGYGAK